MTIAYAVGVRNSQLVEVSQAVDAGAGAGLLRIYDGVRPATGGAATTLLGELAFSDPSFPAPVAGVLTANAIANDASAAASGTATWFRIVDSDSNFVIDGDVGTAGSDLNLSTTTITAGDVIVVSSMTITGGNS